MIYKHKEGVPIYDFKQILMKEYKMSIIEWQTGKPDTYGRYIITTKWEEVTADWYDKDLGWFKYSDKDIIAWCPLNKIEPYKL